MEAIEQDCHYEHIDYLYIGMDVMPFRDILVKMQLNMVAIMHWNGYKPTLRWICIGAATLTGMGFYIRLPRDVMQNNLFSPLSLV
jgi:hypothetical protein